MDETYFVNISDPTFLEKAMLSDVKAFLEFSIINQKIQEIKSKKAELFDTLKVEIDEVHTLISELNEKLPHKELLVPEKKKPEVAKTSSKKHPVRKAPSSLSKMARLNQSLEEIERRLEELS